MRRMWKHRFFLWDTQNCALCATKSCAYGCVRRMVYCLHNRMLLRVTHFHSRQILKRRRHWPRTIDGHPDIKNQSCVRKLAKNDSEQIDGVFYFCNLPLVQLPVTLIMEILRAQHVSSETLFLKSSFGKFFRSRWQCERNARFTSVLLKTFKFAVFLIIRKLEGRNTFQFSKTVDKGCDKKDFVITKFKCPIFKVEATKFWSSRFALHLVAPNTQSEMVRMTFYKSAHHKRLWWSRPVPFFERSPNPRTVQFSNIQKTLFWENWFE